MFDFPRAIPDERGCGDREPGGVYAESGLSPYGSPLEYFLFDPPLPLPAGVDLVNKPQLWQRVDPASGEPVLDGETGRPVYDLLIHIGAEHYPHAIDYIEECLPPDELIATARGLVPISDVQEGDEVLTHLGHLRTVTSTIARPYTGTLLSIKTLYWYLPLRLTPDHPVLRACVIRGRKRRKLEGLDGEHITERGFVPASKLRVGDYLCFPIQRDEVDVETVTMSYTKEYGVFRNSIRTPERIAQAQALRVARQSIPLRATLHRLLEQLASRQQWTLDEVRAACSHLYHYDTGLIGALTRLCKKAFLVRVGLARYLVTDKGRRAAAEPYMSFSQLGRMLGTNSTTAARLVNPPDRRHAMHIEVPVNEELMRLIGYYLAEGSVANTTQNGKEGYYNVVELSFGLAGDTEEQGLAEDACRVAQTLGFGASVSTKRGCWRVVINSRHLAHWLIEQFGSGAHHKTIPPWVIALPPVKLRPLLEAYLAGDGYVKGHQRTGTTVSLRLAYAIAQVANRIGWRASIRKSMQEVNPFIKHARGASDQRPMRAIYRVACYENTGTKVFSDGEYLYLPIRSITQDDYTGTVHNLTVADDESYCVGYHVVHNCRRLGASRRLNANLDLSLLTRRSRMLLAHPKAIIVPWRDLTLPERCYKRLPRHDLAFYALQGMDAAAAQTDEARMGPCIFKLWDVLPRDEAMEVFEQEGERPLCLRKIGSTIYQYRPTGEEVKEWEPGFILGLPITGIALIQYADGTVNEKAKAKLLAGMAQNEEMALPFYETDK